VTAADAVVVDASTVIRALLAAGEKPEAMTLIERGELIAHAPELIVAEVANALATGARAGAHALDDAREAYQVFASYDIELHGIRSLAIAAIEVAVTSGLSVYDALYAVLSGALEVPLVTADRRLADAVPWSVLVS
jgi:predicted nucleic acid-binding protein